MGVLGAGFRTSGWAAPCSPLSLWVVSNREATSNTPNKLPQLLENSQMDRLAADLDCAILLKLHPRRQESPSESLMFDARGKNPAAWTPGYPTQRSREIVCRRPRPTGAGPLLRRSRATPLSLIDATQPAHTCASKRNAFGPLTQVEVALASSASL